MDWSSWNVTFIIKTSGLRSDLSHGCSNWRQIRGIHTTKRSPVVIARVSSSVGGGVDDWAFGIWDLDLILDKRSRGPVRRGSMHSARINEK